MKPEKLCLDPGAIRHIQADGLGWGHDLDCGCFRIDTAPRPGLFARLLSRLQTRG